MPQTPNQPHLTTEPTRRQAQILKAIIDEYTINAAPVGSKLLIQKHFRGLSSATIRNEMFALERLNLLEKTHISSGRIPSLAGYRYYEEKLLQPEIDNDLRLRVRAILSRRDQSIDQTIEAAATFINEVTDLPSIVTRIKGDETLCRIDLVPLSNSSAIVLVVSSTGDIIKNTVAFGNSRQHADVATCVRVFNDRLIGTKFSEIRAKLSVLRAIIKKLVHEYEYVVHEIVNRIFAAETQYETDVYGGRALILRQPEFNDRKKLLSVIELLENTSVWEQIAYTQQNTGRTVITFGEELGSDGISVASTVVQPVDGNKHQIAVVGPTRMDYKRIKGLLDLFKEEIERTNNIDDAPKITNRR